MNPVLKILSQHQSGWTFFFSYKLIEHQNISVNWRKFLFPNMISMEKRDLFKFVILNSPLRGMWFKEFLIILRTCQASHFLPMIFFTIHCNCWANDRGELEDGEEVPFFGWYLLNGFYKKKKDSPNLLHIHSKPVMRKPSQFLISLDSEKKFLMI